MTSLSFGVPNAPSTFKNIPNALETFKKSSNIGASARSARRYLFSRSQLAQQAAQAEQRLAVPSDARNLPPLLQRKDGAGSRAADLRGVQVLESPTISETAPAVLKHTYNTTSVGLFGLLWLCLRVVVVRGLLNFSTQ